MPFSKRELSILHLLSQGKSPADIAKQLGLANSTVYNVMICIRQRLQGTGIDIEDLKNLSPDFLKEWESWKFKN